MMNGEAAEQSTERLRQGYQNLVNRVAELERITIQGSAREKGIGHQSGGVNQSSRDEPREWQRPRQRDVGKQSGSGNEHLGE